MKFLSRYLLSSSLFGGTWAYFDNREELEPPLLLIPIVISATVTPALPLLYLYQKVKN